MNKYLIININEDKIRWQHLSDDNIWSLHSTFFPVIMDDQSLFHCDVCSNVITAVDVHAMNLIDFLIFCDIYT